MGYFWSLLKGGFACGCDVAKLHFLLHTYVKFRLFYVATGLFLGTYRIIGAFPRVMRDLRFLIQFSFKIALS